MQQSGANLGAYWARADTLYGSGINSRYCDRIFRHIGRDIVRAAEASDHAR